MLPRKRVQLGGRGYCSYLHDADAAVVQRAEREPTVLGLLEKWLERTPFLDALARLTLLNRVSRARKVIANDIAHPWKPC